MKHNKIYYTNEIYTVVSQNALFSEHLREAVQRPWLWNLDSWMMFSSSKVVYGAWTESKASPSLWKSHLLYVSYFKIYTNIFNYSFIIVDIKDIDNVPSAQSYTAVVSSHLSSSRLALAEWLGVSLGGKIVALGGGIILAEAKKETEQRNLVAANVPPSK